MTIGELVAALNALVAADEYRKDMTVFFGPEDGLPPVAIEGGVIGKDRPTGLAVLCLAPISLRDVGGF